MSWHVLYINPEPWAIGPVSIGRRNGKMFGAIGRNAQLASYQDSVREAIGEQSMLTGKVAVTFYFWRRRDEYETPQARTHRKHEADATNMQKATEDALQSVFYKNDKDVSDVRSVIVEQGPNVIPRIVVKIEPWSGLDWNEIPSHIIDHMDRYQDMAQKLQGSKFVDNNDWNGNGQEAQVDAGNIF